MGFEILIQIYGIWKYLHNFAPPSMNLLLETYGSDSSSDDEDFVVRAPTPRTTVNGRTHAHLPNLLSYYLLTNPDFAPTERPAKKAKTVVPKVKFADLREDVRANAIQTMPSKREFGWLRFYRLSPASSFRFLASYTVRPYSLFPVQRDGNLLSLLDCPFDEPVSGARC